MATFQNQTETPPVFFKQKLQRYVYLKNSTGNFYAKSQILTPPKQIEATQNVLYWAVFLQPVNWLCFNESTLGTLQADAMGWPQHASQQNVDYG